MDTQTDRQFGAEKKLMASMSHFTHCCTAPVGPLPSARSHKLDRHADTGSMSGRAGGSSWWK